jgi:four helix bundle protein
VAEAAADLTIDFAIGLPDTPVHRHLYEQLLSSGTSPESNYRAARRARSTADFIAKLKIVEEEADESMGWLQKLRRAGPSAQKRGEADRLYEMFDEIVALTVASIKTARIRLLPPPKPQRRVRSRRS